VEQSLAGTSAFAVDKIVSVKDTSAVQVSKVADTAAVVAVVAIVVQVIAAVMVVAIVAVVDNSSVIVDSCTAVAAVDIAGIDLVAVALYSPLQHNIMHSKFNLYIYYNASHTCQ
jgi:hypothetical protein